MEIIDKDRIKKLLKIAKINAVKSNHRYKVGAVIWRRKSLISTGRNYPSKSIKSYTKEYMKYPHSIHAEVDAIISAKTNLKGASILVVRVTKAGGLSMAKPCRWCIGYLSHVGINEFFYSIRNG